MSGMEAFRALDLAGAGMRAERRRLEVVAANIANAHTLKTEEGGPYRRREVIFEAYVERGARERERLPTVRVAGVVPDMSELRRVNDPGHPLADADGWVSLPNVDMIFEMVDLMEAMRSYEANLRSIRAFRTMVDAALQIGR